MTTKTPTRSANNNYAAPHTPIASIKRPRSSLGGEKTPSVSKNIGNNSNGKNNATVLNNNTLSPMHPPRPVVEEEESWVGRKVDAFFSPVLSFLGSSNDEENAQDGAELKEVDDEFPAVTDDVQMTEDEEDEEDDLEDEEEEEEEFNPYVFIKSLPPYAAVQHLRPPVALPEKAQDAPDVTLVLDLDETLVHCTVEPSPDSDLTFPVIFHGMEYQVHVKLRPHLFEFLEAIYSKFEVVVFTASQRVYADELLNRIDPERKYIQYRMFRESCLAVEGNFLKDLTVCGRDMKKTILVDNSPHAFGFQVDNGVPIESWFDDPNDTELLKLEQFLQTLDGEEDVRRLVRNQFQTYRKIEDAVAPLGMMLMPQN